MAISGGTVCITHGGAARQVKVAAQERLRLLGMMALEVMEDLARDSENEMVRFQAARDLLNRSKLGAGDSLRVEDPYSSLSLDEIEQRLNEIFLDAGRKAWARGERIPNCTTQSAGTEAA